jgi:hypothetical protein
MTRLLAFTILAWPLLASSAGFRAVQLSSDHTHLAITTSDGQEFEAQRVPEQVGFDSPLISADGKQVGWLALFPNCCASYPISLKLVVLTESRQLHSFEGTNFSIFAWRFSGNSQSVAYSQGVLHGSNFRHFELRSIADSKLLAEYDYPQEDAKNREARRRAPEWVRCVPE